MKTRLDEYMEVKSCRNNEYHDIEYEQYSKEEGILRIAIIISTPLLFILMAAVFTIAIIQKGF